MIPLIYYSRMIQDAPFFRWQGPPGDRSDDPACNLRDGGTPRCPGLPLPGKGSFLPIWMWPSACGIFLPMSRLRPPGSRAADQDGGSKWIPPSTLSWNRQNIFDWTDHFPHSRFADVRAFRSYPDPIHRCCSCHSAPPPAFPYSLYIPLLCPMPCRRNSGRQSGEIVAAGTKIPDVLLVPVVFLLPIL